jgi:hypothetical protein
MFEPTGIFGSVTAHLKARDLAPDLVFTKILNPPSAAPWSSANLSGQTTVLAFFPDTSHNLQSVPYGIEDLSPFMIGNDRRIVGFD